MIIINVRIELEPHRGVDIQGSIDFRFVTRRARCKKERACNYQKNYPMPKSATGGVKLNIPIVYFSCLTFAGAKVQKISDIRKRKGEKNLLKSLQILKICSNFAADL